MQHIHVNKLPTIKHFSLNQLKQLLPIHQQTAIQNLKIIFNNYALSKYPKNLILLPDQGLSIQQQQNQNSIAYYSYLKAIWCEDFEDQTQLIKNSLSYASNLLNYIGVIDQDSPMEYHQNPNIGYVNKVEIFGVIGGQKAQNRMKKYDKIQQKKSIIGFKFQKIRNRIYLILGVNIKTRQSLAISCSILRQWNLNRLKITSNYSGIDIDLIHRVIQHLFCLGRGFVRQVNDDYNTYHPNVQKFININEGFNTSEKVLCQRFHEFKLNASNLQHQAVVLVCNVTFQRNVNQASIWQIVSQLVIQWLMQTPINSSCSYASYVYQAEKDDNLIIVLSSHFQTSLKNKFPNAQTLLNGTAQIQYVLFDQIYKKPILSQNPMKKSFQLLHKYQQQQPVPQKSDLTLLRQLTPTQKQLNQSMISQKSNSNQSQNRKSNIKNIIKLQNQLYQTLKLLDLNRKILNPNQIQMIIRNYVKWLKKNTVLNQGVNQKQYQVMQVLNSINNDINAEQFYLYIKNNINETALISQYLLQNNKYNRAIETGKKIANQNLQTLYKNSIKNGLINSKSSIIPCYLKKIILAYIQPIISATPLKVQQVSIPQLVQLIEKKNYSSKYYTSILTIIFPQLFTNFQPVIKLLSPLLSYFIEFLISKDHHQQLVYSFVGDLLYEVSYFVTDNKINLLSNTVYMEDRYAKSLTIKQKKILQMLREGGLKGFGYQVKSHLLPMIQSNKNYTKPEQLLYHIVKIERPLQLLHFYRIISSCHYTPTINQISKYLQKKSCFTEILQKCGPLICYFLDNQQQRQIDFTKPLTNAIGINQKQKGPVNQAQFSSIAQRILRSQSGIFSDMVKLNPNVKIAGIQLKTAMKNMTKSMIIQKQSQQKKLGCLDQQQAIKAYLPQSRNLQYQYVQLALSLKQKYMNYQTLSELQKQYFKQCANTVVQNKNQIVSYVNLSSKVKLVQQQMRYK